MSRPEKRYMIFIPVSIRQLAAAHRTTYYIYILLTIKYLHFNFLLSQGDSPRIQPYRLYF